MKLLKFLALTLFLSSCLSRIHAAELAGKWTSDFDSQIGPQKYAYEFKADGDKFTGKASYDHSMGKGDSVLKEIKLNGDALSFIEDLHVGGMDITVTYSGKISGDEIKLTRMVGDFATEQIVAKRVKAPEAKPAPAPTPAK